jgi:hypothetical protein
MLLVGVLVGLVVVRDRGVIVLVAVLGDQVGDLLARPMVMGHVIVLVAMDDRFVIVRLRHLAPPHPTVGRLALPSLIPCATLLRPTRDATGSPGPKDPANVVLDLVPREESPQSYSKLPWFEDGLRDSGDAEGLPQDPMRTCHSRALGNDPGAAIGHGEGAGGLMPLGGSGTPLLAQDPGDLPADRLPIGAREQIQARVIPMEIH